MNFDSFVLYAAFIAFAARRLLRYLHIFQQEDYNPSRFIDWLKAARVYDRRVSLALAALWILQLIAGRDDLITAVVFAFFCFLEPDPRKTAKKKLVMTDRATRIYATAVVLCLLGAAATLRLNATLLWIVVVQALPLALVVANLLLSPYETHIQSRIMKEASERLAQIDPTVIGITGSFGKTSVKHILGHILAADAASLYTPGSVNTLMGISRIIRERLQNGTRFFIVEMGAYGKNSIAKLCSLTPPDIGLITAIGEAHYERFKSLDAVAHAKFELAEAVLSKAEGKMIVHENVLAQPYAREFVDKNRQKFIVCGTGDGVDLKILKSAQTAAGLTVDVRWQGQDFALFAPLYGAVHADNIALAFAAALVCGIAADRAVLALRTVPQITHRLEVKLQADGSIYIDDAFNSNPRGFSTALEILSLLGAEKGGRKILITPGIVELGQKHDEVHAKLGAEAAAKADIALVVRADKIRSFADAFRAKAPVKPLHEVPNLAKAQEWLGQNGKPGDIILIENDLPDLGEAKLIL